MKSSTKILTIIIIFFVIIAGVIIGRTMIGMHFQKKFSKRPPPGIIVTEVIKNEFSEMWIENNQYYMRFRNFDFNILWGDNTKTYEKLKKLKAFCIFIQNDSLDVSPKKIDLSIESQIVATD